MTIRPQKESRAGTPQPHNPLRSSTHVQYFQVYPAYITSDVRQVSVEQTCRIISVDSSGCQGEASYVRTSSSQDQGKLPRKRIVHALCILQPPEIILTRESWFYEHPLGPFGPIAVTNKRRSMGTSTCNFLSDTYLSRYKSTGVDRMHVTRDKLQS